MHIRGATLDDAEGIALLSRQLGYPATSAEVRRFIAILLQHGDQVIFLAEDEYGTICEWVHVYLARRLFMPAFGELGGIVVDEGRRGMGVGKALLEQAESWAVERGCKWLWIRSNTQRAGTHLFYEKIGYGILKSQLVFTKQIVGMEDGK